MTRVLYFFMFLLLSIGTVLAQIKTIDTPIKKMVTSLNGAWIGTFDALGTIKIWNAETGELYKTLMGHTGKVNALVFSPNGDYLASATQNGEIWVWLVKTGELRRQYSGTKKVAISSLAFDQTGELLLAGGIYGSWFIFNEATTQLIQEKFLTKELFSSIPTVSALTVDKESDILYVAMEHEIVMYSIESGYERDRRVIFSKSKEEFISSMAISPDDKFITIGGGAEGITFVIYSLPNWNLICKGPIRIHPYAIFWVEWQSSKVSYKYIAQWEPQNKRLIVHQVPIPGPSMNGELVYKGGYIYCENAKVYSSGPAFGFEYDNYLLMVAINGKVYSGERDGSLRLKHYRAPQLPIIAPQNGGEALSSNNYLDLNIPRIEIKKLENSSFTNPKTPHFTFIDPIFSLSEIKNIRLKLQVNSNTPLHDNFTVLLNGKRVPCNLDIQQKCDCPIELIVGENKLFVSVSNNDGISEPFERIINYNPTIKFKAVFVINDTYKDSLSWPKIHKIWDTVKEIRNVLEKNYNYTVEILYNQSRSNILNKLSQVQLEKYNQDDHLLLIFIGHTGIDNNRGYYVPYDVVGKFKENQGDFIRYVNVFDHLAHTPCNHQLLIMDGFFASLTEQPNLIQNDNQHSMKTLKIKPFGIVLNSGLSFDNKVKSTESGSGLLSAILQILQENQQQTLDFNTFQEKILKKTPNTPPKIGFFKEHQAGSNFVFLRQ